MVKFCITCKKILPIYENKCSVCGNRNLLRFCPTCKKIISDNSMYCPSCGDIDQTMIDTPNNIPRNTNNADIPSKGLNILSFFFPLLGLILYLVLYETTPIKANEIKQWALNGFIMSLTIAAIFWTILFFT